MQVQAVNNNQPSFGAKIVVKTKDMQTYMDYLARYTKAEKPYYNSSKDLELTNKIFDAFEKHPSKEEIVPDVAYLKNTLTNAIVDEKNHLLRINRQKEMKYEKLKKKWTVMFILKKEFHLF